jgi:uncharacterized protein (UPF0332 family)
LFPRLELGCNIPTVTDSSWQRTFDQAMTLWVGPEIEQRQKQGLTPKPFRLRAAQVLFPPDGGQPVVRLNEQVILQARIKRKSGVRPIVGDTLRLDDIEHIEDIEPSPDADPDAGHLTIFLWKRQWVITFDFRYNQGLIKKHLAVADEFLAGAMDAAAKQRVRSSLDLAYSAAELAAKARLLTMPQTPFRTKASHRGISTKFNAGAKKGIISSDHAATLNRLADLRDAARYVRRDVRVTDDEVDRLIANVKAMLAEARAMVRRP